MSTQINQAINQFGENVNIGVLVEDLETSQVLYQLNADRYFAPASNQKLLTAWAALNVLGPTFRYQTDVYYQNKNIYFTFTGDPTLTLDELNQLITGLAEKGIHHISGDIVIDDTALDNKSMMPGAAWDDGQYCYGAPVGALILDHNCVTAELKADTTLGKPAHLEVKHLPQFIGFVNDAITGDPAEARCKLQIHFKDNHYIVSGCIKTTDPVAVLSMSIVDPRQNIESALRYLLKKNNITFSGKWHYQKNTLNTKPIASVSSPAMRDLIALMLKPSDNLIANAIFKTIGAARAKQPGSWDNGALALHDFFQNTMQMDLPLSALTDGAGASRYIYHQPLTMIALLKQAYHSPYAEMYIHALPVAGVDGTLKNRMKEAGLAHWVFAKTGSMTGVSTLSGFVMQPHQHPLVFSIAINGFVDANSKYEALEDALCKAMLR